jgi:hypothetical protein
MRRTTIILSAALMLLAIAPAGALARHHRHHQRRHHSRLERFGDVSGGATTASSANDAGTVQSFTGGVLTIALNDGSTVSGGVTNDTEVECAAPEQAQTMHEDGDGGGGDGDSSAGEAEEQNCSAASLTPGAVVREAELGISSAGSAWKKVELDS